MKEKLKRIFKKIGKNPITYIILLSVLILILLVPELIFAAGYMSALAEIGAVKAIRLISQLLWSVIILALHFLPILLLLKLITQAISLAKQFSVVSKIKKALRENKRDFNAKTSLYHAGGLSFGVKMAMRGRKNDINVVVIRVRRKYAKYHFSTPENVEMWTKKLTSFGSRNYARVVTYGQWVQKGRIKLPKWENGENYAIFDSARLDITSDERGESPYRISGDRLFDTFTVYTADKFVEYLEKR